MFTSRAIGGDPRGGPLKMRSRDPKSFGATPTMIIYRDSLPGLSSSFSLTFLILFYLIIQKFIASVGPMRSYFPLILFFALNCELSRG